MMDRLEALNSRHALKLLAGGGVGATALKTLAGGAAGFVSLMGAMPDPLEAAQVATRRGLP